MPTLSRVPALLALVLACLLAGACSDDSGVTVEDTDPTPIDLQAVGVGQDVTVLGTVSDVLSVNSFEIVGALDSGEPLLVIAPDAVPLSTGARVTVSGSVEEFDDANVSRYGLDGADLPPVTAGRRFVLADAVDAPVTGTNSD